jgi:hypothetical protein
MSPTYANDPPSNLRADLPLTLIRDLHYQDLRALEKRSQHGDNILLTLFVLRVPNLKRLELQGFEDRNESRFTRLPLVIEELGRVIYTDLDIEAVPRRFEFLQSLRLGLDEWGHFPASAVLPFLVLPRLKSLTLDGWGSDHHPKRYKTEKRCNLFGSEWPWPVRASSVEELYLYKVDARHQMVSPCS